MTARHSGSGRQPNFAALNRGRHLYSAGRPSRWALAHILVSKGNAKLYWFIVCLAGFTVGLTIVIQCELLCIWCLPYYIQKFLHKLANKQSLCLLASLCKNFWMDLRKIIREGWQWASEQVIKFWWRSGSGICIAALVRRSLVDVCTVTVLLVTGCLLMFWPLTWPWNVFSI